VGTQPAQQSQIELIGVDVVGGEPIEVLEGGVESLVGSQREEASARILGVVAATELRIARREAATARPGPHVVHRAGTVCIEQCAGLVFLPELDRHALDPGVDVLVVVAGVIATHAVVEFLSSFQRRPDRRDAPLLHQATPDALHLEGVDVEDHLRTAVRASPAAAHPQGGRRLEHGAVEPVDEVEEPGEIALGRQGLAGQIVQTLPGLAGEGVPAHRSSKGGMIGTAHQTAFQPSGKRFQRHP